MLAQSSTGQRKKRDAFGAGGYFAIPMLNPEATQFGACVSHQLAYDIPAGVTALAEGHPWAMRRITTFHDHGPRSAAGDARAGLNAQRVSRRGKRQAAFGATALLGFTHTELPRSPQKEL